jgi:thiol-disulfide isomerase/thioredoxin
MALLMFTGTECSHCHEMDPLVEKLEKELKIKVKKLEVWHSDVNKKKMDSLDNGKCGGVPFFYNEKTKKTICGSTSFNNLKKWATG